nr:VEZP12 [Haliotis tuberculata]
MGPVSKSAVALSLADVTGTPLKGRLNIGKLVILKAVLVGNHPTEASFHALSCKAICNKKEYVILNAGCGDGTVISQRNGFTTKGKVAVSPIFRFFRMDLNKPVMFQCTFIICKNCDGNSCEDPDRRKRHLSTSERRPELEKGKRIITARVVVPPFREPPLNSHQHSVVPVGISSRLEAIDVVPGSEAARGIPGSEAARGIPGSEAARGIPGSEAARGIPGSEAARGIPGSEAARDIPGSEAARGIPDSEAARGIPGSEAARDIPGTWDLVLTILVAVIIPLVFLVVIMLIFVIAISRALRSLSVLYKDVDRLRRQVVVDDVKEDVKKDVQVDIKAILG